MSTHNIMYLWRNKTNYPINITFVCVCWGGGGGGVGG